MVKYIVEYIGNRYIVDDVKIVPKWNRIIIGETNENIDEENLDCYDIQNGVAVFSNKKLKEKRLKKFNEKKDKEMKIIYEEFVREANKQLKIKSVEDKLKVLDDESEALRME